MSNNPLKPRPNLLEKISSPKALFIFEAAARHLSFTTAAAELNVMPPAVSRMIAVLEEHIETPLFERHGSRLTLTENGELFYEVVVHSFQSLERMIDQFKIKKRYHNQITMSLSTSFVNHWLMPRLNQFREAFPDVNLRYELAGTRPEGPVSPCDIGIRLDTSAQQGDDQSWCFAPEWIFPLAAPQYLQQFGSLDDPSSEEEHILVEVVNPKVTWQMFAENTGLQLPKNHKIVSVPDYSFAVQMALAGSGVVLGFVISCGTHMLNGSLSPVSVKHLRTGHDYILLAPTEIKTSEIKQRVCRWFLAQMEEELTQLKREFFDC